MIKWCKLTKPYCTFFTQYITSKNSGGNKWQNRREGGERPIAMCILIN